MTGCTEGIGQAFAMELGRRGCHVALVARNKDKMKAIAGEIGEWSTYLADYVLHWRRKVE